jgi:hypothetical protein
VAIQNQPLRPKTLPPAKQLVPVEAAREAAAKVAATAPKKEGALVKFVLGPVFSGLHFVLDHAPWLNKALGHVTGPLVKRRFNTPPGVVEKPAPPPLEAKTIEEARQTMVKAFDPEHGKVVLAISGGGAETVHCFVVSGVKPDGKVMITQALAQTTDQDEPYKGLGGKIEKWLDKKLGNQPKRMAGVVEDNWSEYAARSKRNSIVVMQLDADPAKAQQALAKLKSFVGRPYDHTMLSSVRATEADNMEMFCTEISSWFANELHPGAVQQSSLMGWKVFQVTDHMQATDVHGGPLKVLFNGQNRLDIAGLDPHPRFDAKAVVEKALPSTEKEASSLWARLGQILGRAIRHG